MAGGNFGTPTNGGRKEYVTCEDLSISNNITSQEVSLFNDLELGQILDVRLIENDRAVGLFSKDIYIGSLTDPKTTQLIKCLKEGKNFFATIQKIDDAFISILIMYNQKSS